MQERNCAEDREGNRHSDRCQITSTQIGQQYQNRKMRMRKVLISKMSGGKEIAKVYCRGDLIRTSNIVSGYDEPLYFAKEPYKADFLSLEIETVELGENGKSEYEILCEWEVKDPGNVDFDEVIPKS